MSLRQRVLGLRTQHPFQQWAVPRPRMLVLLHKGRASACDVAGALTQVIKEDFKTNVCLPITSELRRTGLARVPLHAECTPSEDMAVGSSGVAVDVSHTSM